MSVMISGFADEIDQDFEVQLKTVTELGMQAISIRSAYGKLIADYSETEVEEKLLSLLHRFRVSVSSISSLIGKVPITDRGKVEEQMAQLDGLCKIARLLSCGFIRVFSFYMPEQGFSPETYREEVLAALRCMTKIAEENGIVLLHENEKGIYADTAGRNLDLLQSVNSQYFKAAFDFANYVQCGEDPEKCWELLHPYIAYYHIKDADAQTGENVVCGAGDGKIAKILHRAIREDHYAGYLTLEPHLVPFDMLSLLERGRQSTRGKTDAEAGRAAFQKQYHALVELICIE